MTVLIVEDEAMSRARLARNIGARFPDLTIVGHDGFRRLYGGVA